MAKAIGDMAAFVKAARAFERLPEHDARRIAGFAAYAGHVLPVNKKKGKREFPAVWQKHKVLKTAISSMSQGFCAYCQVPVTASHAGKTPGQVEHFRPKARFPMKAYDVKNYFLSCEACNGAKSDKWPRGGYVRPDQGKPGERFVFEAGGKVKAKARDGVAKSTIVDLELNRKGLVELRRVMVASQLAYVREFLRLRAKVAGLRVKPPLVDMFSPVSEAINQNVRRAWKRRA